MEDDDELEMFVEAQDSVWTDVVAELTAGKKTSHWMWFVFPQLASLGENEMASLYGMHDLDEATAYLKHPTLRDRLEEVAGLVMTHAGKDIVEIFGETDAKKLQSSMTLFANVPAAADVFAEVIVAFFAGQTCATTTQEI